MKTRAIQCQNDAKCSLWSMRQVMFAAFIAGPLGGCYLLGSNYKASGHKTHALKCYITGVISTALLMITCYLMPDELMARIPFSIVPCLYAGPIGTFASYQQKWIKARLAQESKRHTFFRSIFVVLTLLAVQLLLIFLVFWCISLTIDDGLHFVGTA